MEVSTVKYGLPMMTHRNYESKGLSGWSPVAPANQLQATFSTVYSIKFQEEFILCDQHTCSV